MFTGQLSSTDASEAAVLRVTRGNAANVDVCDATFTALYSMALDPSAEPGSELGTAGSWLDSNIDAGDWLLARYDFRGLRTAMNEGLGRGPAQATPAGAAREPSQSHSSVYGPIPMGPGASEQPVANQEGETRSSLRNFEPISPDGNRELPNPADVLNKSQLANWMSGHALSRSSHHCAKYFRLGMEAIGHNTGDRPSSGDAGDYGPFLLRHGAKEVPQKSYTPQAGDVVVFDKTDQHPSGHIETYDGHHWVSDFKQHSFSPYRDVSSTPSFTIYRLT